MTVTISPKNTAPSVSYNKVALLGIATYTPTQRDADGDLLTYTITTAPTKGTVLINLNLGLVSTIVYTANNLVIPADDSFVVTGTDGHGGTNVQTLNPF